MVAIVAGCNPNDPFRKYAGAVGPDLHSKQTVSNTNLLNAYTSNICVQAGLSSSESDGCILSTPADWKTFVDMGLYDIDQRCDTFLDGLYYKEKSTDPILAQISNTRTFTHAVLEATKSSSVAIWIVAAAFDLTEATFRNSRMGLLEALDPTTVKSIVFRRQQDVKKEIYGSTISSKPQALHALRTYLRVCMPFTIEMEANAVLTTVQRTGEVGESPIVFNDVRPLEPGQQFGSGGRKGQGIKPGKDFDKVFSNSSKYDAKDMTNLQLALCLKGDGVVGKNTIASIKIFEATSLENLSSSTSVPNANANGLIDDFEFNVITGLGPCSDNNQFRNFYERMNFQILPKPTDRLRGTIRAINAVAGTAINEDTKLSDDALRKAIEVARQKLGASDYDGFALEQITPALNDLLFP